MHGLKGWNISARTSIAGRSEEQTKLQGFCQEAPKEKVCLKESHCTWLSGNSAESEMPHLCMSHNS